ncbi:pirin family protein [Brevibacillus laterosporus]|uniref:pirin family protein n=1 Tax=Brevibacillus TaxID=55080 RepID=UPI001B13CDB9|nr:pirin family protein [Brevibacillus halotolerans]GIO01035.1 quercetin 2,3-dioxygenase [Brevibacillus halotolerans]
MIKIFPSDSRFQANHGWLKSQFSFSFAEYYDPENMNFGPMRVLNDDTIQAGYGFGTHPHKEMEIVTIMLEGVLRHKDSTGNEEELKPGEIQRMSAGTGILHSEYNGSTTEEAKLLQLWFEPKQYGLTPSYEQFAYDQKAMLNALLPVVSTNQHEHRVAHIHQDMTIYLSRLEAGKNIVFPQQTNRRTFLFIMEGQVEVNGQVLERRDSARITDLDKLELVAGQDSYFMLIDLP